MKVGKKYRHIENRETIYECIYSDEQGALFRWKPPFRGNILSSWFSADLCESYKEYKEPVVHIRYVHIWSNPSGIYFGDPISYKLSKSGQTQPGWTFLSVQEIRYVEQ